MWSVQNLDAWKKALASYPDAISAIEELPRKNGLKGLEGFVFTELGSSVKSRSPPYITKEEYCKLVTWKLKRGKWRPRLQKFANETEDEDIRKVSSEAFRLQEKKETKKAIQALVTIKGCGPATASAVLNAADPSVPFMSDELLIAVFGGADKYTLEVYLELVDAVQEKASKLSEDDTDNEWTARDIEHAVYVSVHCPELASGKNNIDSEKKNDTGSAQLSEKKSAKLQKESAKSTTKGDSSKMSTKRSYSSPRSPKSTPSKRKLRGDSQEQPVLLEDETPPSNVRRSKRLRQQE